MNRTTIIPTNEHNKGLLEEHSVAERSVTCSGGDVELSIWNKLGKEKENNKDSDGGVVVKGVRRRDKHLLHEQDTGTSTRSSNKIAVQKETSLFDFALSFVPKGDEWRSQRR